MPGIVCAPDDMTQRGKAHLQWDAPAPSAGCSCHFISEIKLKLGKRATPPYGKLAVFFTSEIHIQKIKHDDFQIYFFINFEVNEWL